MQEALSRAKKGRASSAKPSRATSEETQSGVDSRLQSLADDHPIMNAPTQGHHPQTATTKIDLSLPVELEGQPLSVLAWCRIIDRAQRGIGDASYNSDDDDVAQEEAADERPRGELTRVVRSLHTIKAAGITTPNLPLASDEALAMAKARLLMPARR
ncbi:hypothetical protein CF327_g6081 [Tilletia walkeri]|nr:hypothetical protein CF327_g6079 [Tilletia walkeri]KAE8209998.1 hypothetical protein CF327_g6081 [Tilletia walkeri]